MGRLKIEDEKPEAKPSPPKPSALEQQLKASLEQPGPVADPTIARAVVKVAQTAALEAHAQANVAQTEAEVLAAKARAAEASRDAEAARAVVTQRLTPQGGRAPRLTLVSVVKGKQIKPPRLFCYGVEGIGKSTLGAGAPNPIFIGAEDGTSQLDVARFPQPETLTDVYDALTVLEKEKHDYGALVIDTTDWLEAILWRHICARDSQENIEGYGYGKGYQVAIDEWRKVIVYLDRVRLAKSIPVILLGHSLVKPFKNPEGEDFDRYQLKMNEKAGGLLKEWCDVVVFANYETFAKRAARDEKNKNALAKGISSGARLLYTERTAAWDAKNRYSLPYSIPLSWADLAEGIRKGQTGQAIDVEAMKAEIGVKAGQLLDEAQRKKVLDYLGLAGVDGLKLQQLNNYANARLAEQRKAG